MALGTWLSIIGLILGGCGVIGVAYAVLRSNVATKTIELWKQQAEAMEERYSTEKEIRHDCESNLDEAFDRIEKLEDASKTLANILAKNIDEEALKTLTILGVDKATRRKPRGPRKT